MFLALLALDSINKGAYIARMIRKIAILFIVMLGATLLFVNHSSQEKAVQGEVPIGGDFALMTHLNQSVTNDSYAGKPRLISFGFTHCPDICPTTLATKNAALEEMRGEAPVGLFVTVDPARDTREQLALYMQNFPQIIGLTGTEEQIKAAAKTYRIYYKKVENKEHPEDYVMDHTPLIYLMDGDGKYLAHFPHTISTQELVARIRQAL